MVNQQQQQNRDGRGLTSGENGRKGLTQVTPETRSALAHRPATHGILSAEVVIARLGEREDDFAALRGALWAELAPVGVVETMLADLILTSYWRLRRVVVAEGGMLVQRALSVARERGVASDTALAAFDAAQLPSGRDVERVIRYQAALTRELYRAIDKLVEVQRARKGQGDGA